MEKVTERKQAKKEKMPYAFYVRPSGGEEESGNGAREELCFLCSFLPLPSPSPSSILHAAANVWMLGWRGKTLSKIYFCWTILHSFFPPADNSVNSRLLCEAVNLEITYLMHTLLLKSQTKKIDSWDQGGLQPDLVHYLRVRETLELDENTIWDGGWVVVLGIRSGKGKDALSADGTSSSKTRSIWMKSNSGLELFWNSGVDKLLCSRILGNKCENVPSRVNFCIVCECKGL